MLDHAHTQSWVTWAFGNHVRWFPHIPGGVIVVGIKHGQMVGASGTRQQHFSHLWLWALVAAWGFKLGMDCGSGREAGETFGRTS